MNTTYYNAKLSDGSTVRVIMTHDEHTGSTTVFLKYPVGSRRWPDGYEVSFRYGTYEQESVLRKDGKIERLPHDLIAEVQVRILRDWLCHIVEWTESHVVDPKRNDARNKP